jgi:predicted protein tyrosine phosphatase
MADATAAENCGGDVPFNAGPATDAPIKKSASDDDGAAARLPLIIGAARPGAIRQRCYDLSAPKVTAAEVDAWADEMITKHGARRVIGLLTTSELETYEPGALERLRERFPAEGGWRNVDGVKGARGDANAAALREVLDLIDAGVKAGDTVVVHCWGGGGRTGNALAGWLAARASSSPAPLSAEEAARVVSESAARQRLKRRADAAGAQQYVDADKGR